MFLFNSGCSALEIIGHEDSIAGCILFLFYFMHPFFMHPSSPFVLSRLLTQTFAAVSCLGYSRLFLGNSLLWIPHVPSGSSFCHRLIFCRGIGWSESKSETVFCFGKREREKAAMLQSVYCISSSLLNKGQGFRSRIIRTIFSEPFFQNHFFMNFFRIRIFRIKKL